MKVREYITDILYRVNQEHGYANLIMRKEGDLSQADRAFASNVIYGTLRNQTLLEYQWRDLVQKKVRPRTACVLNMSIYQLFFMDRVPSYAVIHEGAETAGKYEKGFVNALLRKVLERGLQMPKGDDLSALSTATSHPLWILEMWNAHYGLEKTRAVAKAQQNVKKTWGRWNTLKGNADEGRQNPQMHFVSDTCFSYDGILSKDPLFQNGTVVIQDKNAQAVAGWLEVEENMKVLDVCAAPGTKTQQISALMHNTGMITACDLYENRLDLVRAGMKKCGSLNVQYLAADMRREGVFEASSFDRILIDAPCSGLGDLSHKPEIRWHLKPADIDDVIQIQKEILHAAAAYLKPGGILVYSTCTLNKKENEKQTDAFVRLHSGFEKAEEHTYFPDDTEGDGFYVAQLRKKG